MWHSDHYVFDQFIVRGKSFDPHIFEILVVIPPTADHDYWEIDFKDGTKMVTTESVSLQFGSREMVKMEEEEEEEKEFKSVRIG